ncbi:MAG: diguanylate cyclase [Acidobacteria bacterium]|nr:diguanylate cyclase [Acidobacteriota bacterium]MDW7983230.1 diguanylate cyclase [Acidobacteriota bacterium]
MKLFLLALPDPEQRSQIGSTLLEETNCAVEVVEDEEAALQWMRANGVDLALAHTAVIRDPRLWVQLIKSDRSTGYWIVIGPGRVDVAVDWMRRGADYYIDETTPADEVIRILRSIWQVPPRPWASTTRTEQTLLQVIREISRSMDDFEKLLNLVIDVAMEIGQADYGSLLLYHPQTARLEVAQQRGHSAPADATWGLLGLSLTTLDEWFQMDAPVFLATPNAYHEKADAPRPEIRSLLVLPIHAGPRPIGGLLLAKTFQLPGNFTQNTVQVLQTFASDLGPVLRNALLQVQTQELNFKDDLTDAYNRRYFEYFLEEEIRRSERFGARLSVIFVDLDNLKTVNEKYGHMMGSKTLQEVAHRMILAVRGSDRVVRYGGDEFCVLLPETDTQGALQVAERLRSEIASRPFLTGDGLDIYLTASLGVATYPTHGLTKEELVQAADRAMYEVKSTTKNGIRVASPFPTRTARSS